MNTDNRKFKVILTRRLAQQVDAGESEATLTPLPRTANDHTDVQNGDTSIECCTLVHRELCSDDDVDNSFGQRLRNGADHDEAVDTSVGGRINDSERKAVNQFYPFSVIDFLVINVSVVFFCIDFMTDILLAKDYYDDGMMLEFALTSSFVAGSFLVTGILSSIWHAQEKSRRNICLIILAFPFATIERYKSIYVYNADNQSEST